MSTTPLEALPLDELRERSSTKWRMYPTDVLPLFVAEMDFALAPAVTRRLQRAVELGDTGYTPPQPGVAEAFAEYWQRRIGWTVDPAHVFPTGDVMMGVVEILRQVLNPGDGVVIMPPVYPPFTVCIEEAGAVVKSVPLARTDEGWAIDLAGVEAALVEGARAILLCNPQNPTGTVHSRESLAALAEISAAHGAIVVSDEIHAPLTYDAGAFTPFTAASATAAEVGFIVTSASKSYNLAGLKCAVMVAGTQERAADLRALPIEVGWRTGLFGAMANVAAYSEESDAWIDSLLVSLDHNRRLLADLLAEHLPEAAYRIPDAGYLAWIDLTALGWGDDPAVKILDEAKVALHFGPQFGVEGNGHVRVNFACAPDVLREAVARIGALARS